MTSLLRPRTTVVSALLTLAFSCQDPLPSLLRPEATIPADLQPGGCWELRSLKGPSDFLPEPRRLSLDNRRRVPHDSGYVVFEIERDTTQPDRVRIARWGPVHPRGFYVFLGDGFTGLEMWLTLKGDTLTGPSAKKGDDGTRHRGPKIQGVRAVCP